MFSFFKKQPEPQTQNPLSAAFGGFSSKQKYSIFYLLFLSTSGEDALANAEFQIVDDVCSKLGISQSDAFDYFQRNAGGLSDRPEKLIIGNLQNLLVPQKEMLVTLVFSMLKANPNQTEGKITSIMGVLEPIGISQQMFTSTANKVLALMNQIR